MSATGEAAPSRRSMLQLMGASMLLGGLAACKPARGIVPYVRQPEDVIPSRKSYYATTLAIDGQSSGRGVRLFPSVRKVWSGTWPVRL